MSSEITEKSERQLQLHLYTKQKQFAVPDVPYPIRANVSNKELNVLINTLLKDTGNSEDGKAQFDFLLNGEFVKIPLGQHLKERDISFEDTVELEYVERYPAPEPQDCLLHDDWVSAIEAKDNWILTGCYDSTVNIWTAEGKHKLTIPGHTEPVKGVTWISLDVEKGVFASASHDTTVMTWEWNVAANSVECVHIFEHEQEVECIAVNRSKTRLATGSRDGMVNIWSIDLGGDEAQPSTSKGQKLDQNNERKPILTLEEHSQRVSGVQWIDDNTLVSSSWDYTMIIWDLTQVKIKTNFYGPRSFFDLSYSHLNGLITAAFPNKSLRVYDPKSKEYTEYNGHTGWVQSVCWSTTNEYLFVSGAYDNHVKLWDYRSTKAPIFELINHEGKVLTCDWSNPKLILSGGWDNAVRVCKSKIAIGEQK